MRYVKDTGLRQQFTPQFKTGDNVKPNDHAFSPDFIGETGVIIDGEWRLDEGYETIPEVETCSYIYQVYMTVHKKTYGFYEYELDFVP